MQYRNMTTVLTREYLDVRPDGWLEYAPKRIAQLYVDSLHFASSSFCQHHTIYIPFELENLKLAFILVFYSFFFNYHRGADKCYNKTLCEEHLDILLPAKPPFHPRQFKTCAVVGNSGDLLKTEFGEEIDSHDAVIRDNEAPVNEVSKYTLLLVLCHNRVTTRVV